MNELLTTLGGLISSLGNAQSATALKEHLALVNTKLQMVKEHVVQLETENSQIKMRNTELEQQLLRQQTDSEFVEKKGALFKRLADGTFSDTPICASCRKTMWCFQDVFPYECSDKNCGHIANFTGSELSSILASLQSP